ncbi:hypothetical protein BDZ45DRAFT_747007 [Acephala macrosclerotiorum]|nr:hypothetical protein BDZ45DRAFT_747007 [Acephala macrosclerotiorum]
MNKIDTTVKHPSLGFDMSMVRNMAINLLLEDISESENYMIRGLWASYLYNAAKNFDLRRVTFVSSYDERIIAEFVKRLCKEELEVPDHWLISKELEVKYDLTVFDQLEFKVVRHTESPWRYVRR